MKKTLVIGASENPDRYSNKAIKALRNHGHEVVAIAPRPGKVADVTFETDKPELEQVDTVTLYVGPQNQDSYIDYILKLNPKRVIFNPGTENDQFITELQKVAIRPEIACTLVLLATGQY